METLSQDLRYGLRLLLKTPGFTAVAALALSLGIGANSAVFSVVNTVLLRALPYKDPGRLMAVSEIRTEQARSFTSRSVAPANFLDWRGQNRAFEQMAAFSTSRGANLTDAGEAERIRLTVCSASFFPILGVQAMRGRTFLPDEDTPDHDQVVVVSHGFWQRRFGGDPALVGRTLTIDGDLFAVVGAMPPSFDFPKDTDVWVLPRRIVPEGAVSIGDETRVRGLHYLDVIGRLKPGFTVKQAQTEMAAIANRLRQQYPATNRERRVSVTPLHESLVGDIRPALLVLLGAVVCLLLTACASVATLLLARATARRKEMGIRAALGAPRLRIVRQLLTESLLLAFLGGALGLLLAGWSLDLLVALSPPNMPRVKEISVDRWVLGWTLIVCVMTGIVFGLAPALHASRPDVSEALKEDPRASTGTLRRHHVRSLLVITEVALAFVLLIGEGLLLRSFLRLQQVTLGFSPRNVLTLRVAPTGPTYRENHQQMAFYEAVLERVETLPGILAVGAIDNLPISGVGSYLNLTIEGRPAPTTVRPSANYRMISPQYFRAMGIPLLKGRTFTKQDNERAPGVVIISETFVRSFFPDDDPIGKRLAFSTSQTGQPVWLEIVGVVGDVRTEGLTTEPKPEAYQPHLQHSWPGMSFVIRTSSDPMGLAAAVREAVRAVDKSQPVAYMKTMEQIIADSLVQARFAILVMGLFSGVALVLAAVGIYGVMADSVTQRTHEIGIRLALGAGRRAVLTLLVGEGMVLALIGLATGWAGALVLTRLMASLLYEVSATDRTTLAVISLLLAAVALLACVIPARRAMSVDPLVALRYE